MVGYGTLPRSYSPIKQHSYKYDEHEGQEYHEHQQRYHHQRPRYREQFVLEHNRSADSDDDNPNEESKRSPITNTEWVEQVKYALVLQRKLRPWWTIFYRPLSFRTILWIILFIVLTTVAVVISFQQYDNLSGNNHISNKLQGVTAPEVFDFIIVGGGPSGIIVATKLAKKLSNRRILLLESGTTSQSSVIDNLKTNQAFKKGNKHNSHNLQDSASESWLTSTEINKFDIPLLWSGLSSNQGRINPIDGSKVFSNHHWPIHRTLLARALGGCGIHNAMIYIRCLPTDIDRWNLTGWKYDTILDHYRQLEKYVDDDWASPSFWNHTSLQNKEWRGRNGLLWTVPAGPKIDTIAPLFIHSALTSGIPLATKGFNHPDPKNRIGAGYYEFNIHDGTRYSVAQALLGNNDIDVAMRPNLEIRTGCTVSRVLIGNHEDQQPSATGVEYITAVGDVKTILATTEVILSAGAILSPQILFNSGIGPNGTVVDLSGVGKNVQDHPVVAMAFRLNSTILEEAPTVFTMGDELEEYQVTVAELKTLPNNDRQSDSQNYRETRQSLHERLGAMATAGFSSGAFLRSPWAKDESPDIQLTVFPRVLEPHVLRKQRSSDTHDLRTKAMLVTVALLRPQARYEIHSATKDRPLLEIYPPEAGKSVKPQLQFNLPSIDTASEDDPYLSDVDVDRIKWGIEQVRRIQSTPPLADYTEKELYPGQNFPSLDEFVRQNHLPNSHWVGSTKMGHDDDPMAVLDEKFRVRGVQGLRVVDAGAIPHVPNGNTHSTVCIFASIAADMIVAQQQQQQQEQQQ